MGKGELPVKQLDGPPADDGGEDLGVGGPQQKRRVLEEVAHADSRDEHSQGRGLSQGLVGQFFHDDAQQRADEHRQRHARNGRQTVAGDGVETNVGPHHDDVAVGKVQHLGDTVDHRIAQRDDGVDAAQADATDKEI